MSSALEACVLNSAAPTYTTKSSNGYQNPAKYYPGSDELLHIVSESNSIEGTFYRFSSKTYYSDNGIQWVLNPSSAFTDSPSKLAKPEPHLPINVVDC